MQPMTMFFFFAQLFLQTMSQISLGLTRLRFFLDLYFSDLSRYIKVTSFKHSVRI